MPKIILLRENAVQCDSLPKMFKIVNAESQAAYTSIYNNNIYILFFFSLYYLIFLSCTPYLDYRKRNREQTYQKKPNRLSVNRFGFLKSFSRDENIPFF